MGRLHIIKVPDVGEGIAEVELVEWAVAVGDTVAEDQVLAGVMTDKAHVDIPSPVAGTVQALGGEVGQMLAVGSELIRIEVGEGAGTVLAPKPVAAPAPAAVKAAAVPAQAAALPGPSARPSPPAAAPVAATKARPIASPAVRRRAWELGLDLAQVTATGTAGRIVHADLNAAVAAGVPRSTPAPAAPPAVPRAAPGAARDDVQTIPMIGLRRRIAMKMQESKRRIPHYSYVEQLDVTDAEALRAALNARWGAERGHLTVLPLLMRALVLAIAEFPQLNAHFDDEQGVITRHGAVHLGIATQTPNGLMVPVVRHAETLDLWGLAGEVARLAESARAGRATRDELSGSTITISSLGALGGIVSTPVINRPEVAIVGVNRIVEMPVVRDGAIVVRRTMNLSSSFDHRVIDGDDAARFIQAVKQLIEVPGLLLAG
ncbi:MAG: 2-oxo acid dehydrogenase subunit E2 [Rubrivivax sp.]|nr:2-oxo acid dehydrogenase subunit E2 [Rubrivivax sp.]